MKKSFYFFIFALSTVLFTMEIKAHADIDEMSDRVLEALERVASKEGYEYITKMNIKKNILAPI